MALLTQAREALRRRRRRQNAAFLQPSVAEFHQETRQSAGVRFALTWKDGIGRPTRPALPRFCVIVPSKAAAPPQCRPFANISTNLPPPRSGRIALRANPSPKQRPGRPSRWLLTAKLKLRRSPPF